MVRVAVPMTPVPVLLVSHMYRSSLTGKHSSEKIQIDHQPGLHNTKDIKESYSSKFFCLSYFTCASSAGLPYVHKRYKRHKRQLQISL